MNSATLAKSSIAALVVAIALAWVAFVHDEAEADTDFTSFNVAVAVNVRCSISTGSVNFPSTYVSGQVANIDAQGSLVINCDPGRRVNIKLGQGMYPAPGSNDNNPLRRVGNGVHRLNYNLYEDAARTVVWDNRHNAVKTTRIFPFTAIVYGRIFGSQTVTPGYYSDTVVGTVNY